MSRPDWEETADESNAQELCEHWRSLARQERDENAVLRESLAAAIEAKADAESMVLTLRADYARAEAENRWWRDRRWWYRLLWWRRP